MFDRNQEGASALEFALVLPILVVLIFGAFMVGLGYDRKLSLAHSARDAGRFGATLAFAADADGTPNDAWFDQIRDRAVAASTGQLKGDGGEGTQICIAHVEGRVADDEVDLKGTSEAVRYAEGAWDIPDSSADSTSDDYCYVDGLGDPFTPPDGVPPEDWDPDLQARVQVVVLRPFSFDIVLLPRNDMDIVARSVARFERTPAE